MKKEQHLILLEIEKLPEGVYLATSPDVQGLVVEAKTIEEIVEIAVDAAKTLIPLQAKKHIPRRIISYPVMVPA